MKLTTGAGVVALAIALGITPAAAQTSTQPSTQPAPSAKPSAPVTGQIMTQDTNTVLAKEFIGLSVYAPDKTRIGTISDLILSKDAKTVDGFVIGVGGFLGIGEKSVALKLDRLKINQTSDGTQLTMDTTKEELAKAPAFKSQREINVEKQAAERPKPQQQQRPGN